MINVTDALKLILDDILPVSSEQVTLCDTHGRVAATTVDVVRAQPTFSSAAMDGYAIRQDDLRGSESSTFKVVGESAAGASNVPTIHEGQAIRVLTGAPLPNGANAVIPQESVTVEDGRILVAAAVWPGDHIRRQGADLTFGQSIVSTGDVLRAGEIANLAAQGILNPEVFRRPRVAILSSGDELIDAGPEPTFGQVTDCTTPMLAAAVQAAGGIAHWSSPLPDQLDAIRNGLREAAETADLIVLTGGMSVGDRDHTRQAMENDGQLSFHRVNMKPGKPVAFGRVHTVPVLGLPGNPVSTFVGWELFGRPALRRLSGHREAERPRRWVRLGQDITRDRERPEFVRGYVRYECFIPHPRQGSADLSSILNTDALGVVQPGMDPFVQGTSIEIIDLRGDT